MSSQVIDIVKPVCPGVLNHRQIRKLRPKYSYITQSDGSILRYIRRADPCKDVLYYVHKP